MIDNERLPERSCRSCGRPLNQNEPNDGELCPRCTGLEAGAGLIMEHLGPQGVLETTHVEGNPLGGIHEIELPHTDAADLGARIDDADGGVIGGLSPADGDDAGAVSADSDHASVGSVATQPAGYGGDVSAVPIVPPAWGGSASAVSAAPPYDPDHPPWGISRGIGVWLFSVLAIILIPAFAVIGWLVYESLANPSTSMSSNAVRNLVMSPSGVLVSVLSLFAAHMITLAVVWAVVTRFGLYPFLPTLGWRWATSPGFPKFWFVIAVVFAMYIIEIALNVALPRSHESDFDKLLKTSQQVRVAVAVLAVLTAPLVEEAVYRGVLFSALISRAGVKWTVIIVTTLFAIVHFPQYWGAWSGLAGITVLSLTLTIVRAKMKSILPCIAVHFLFNLVGAVSIVLQKS